MLWEIRESCNKLPEFHCVCYKERGPKGNRKLLSSVTFYGNHQVGEELYRYLPAQAAMDVASFHLQRMFSVSTDKTSTW